MQNGTYLVQHKQLNTQYKLVSYNGGLKLYDKERPMEFIRTLNDQFFKEFYDVIQQLPGEQNNYNIAWVVGGIVKELINVNAKFAVAKHKINQLKNSTHRTGMLIPVRCDAKMKCENGKIYIV